MTTSGELFCEGTESLIVIVDGEAGRTGFNWIVGLNGERREEEDKREEEDDREDEDKEEKEELWRREEASAAAIVREGSSISLWHGRTMWKMDPESLLLFM